MKKYDILKNRPEVEYWVIVKEDDTSIWEMFIATPSEQVAEKIADALNKNAAFEE